MTSQKKIFTVIFIAIILVGLLMLLWMRSNHHMGDMQMGSSEQHHMSNGSMMHNSANGQHQMPDGTMMNNN